jgi:hypothetical protein
MEFIETQHQCQTFLNRNGFLERCVLFRDFYPIRLIINLNSLGDILVKFLYNVTLHVHTCSGRNRIIPLMQRLNTDSAPNKPVTLPRNQLLIRYAGTSPVHLVTIRCYDTR